MPQNLRVPIVPPRTTYIERIHPRIGIHIDRWVYVSVHLVGTGQLVNTTDQRQYISMTTKTLTDHTQDRPTLVLLNKRRIRTIGNNVRVIH